MSSRTNATRSKRPAISKTISKTFSPSTKPLQDITDEVVHGIPGSDFNMRPRRRPKVPQGPLGQKLKSAVPSSPLPPSSPIASSSSHGQEHLQITPFDDGDMPQNQGRSTCQIDNDDADEWKENIDFSSQWYDGDGNFVEPPKQEDMEEVLSANGSDPFGFFAVEKQLKAERAVQPSRPRGPLQAKVASPPPPKPPRTPHKKRVGKRPIEISSGSSSPERDVLPSSPSPTKRYSEGHSAREPPQTDLHDEDVLVEDVGSDDESPPKATGSVKRRRPAESPVNPQKLAKSLTSLLPKRSSRRAKASRTKEREEPSESEDDHATTRRRQVRSRKRVKLAKRGQAEEIEIDSDHEKLSRAKQARMKYFKELEDYKVAEENVDIPFYWDDTAYGGLPPALSCDFRLSSKKNWYVDRLSTNSLTLQILGNPPCDMGGTKWNVVISSPLNDVPLNPSPTEVVCVGTHH
ncbi:hypothetical protein VNI00_004126 [Paramarasmius palmivorus]|uniref:Uncharacterized protein n=1 Tax=Paramarasmius palmivorus TaxID=297713 RepID=A0AAW0DNA7_9AGAR